MFKNNEKGQQHNWVAIEEEQIREMWTKARMTRLDLMSKLKYIDIPLDLSSESEDTTNP